MLKQLDRRLVALAPEAAADVGALLELAWESAGGPWIPECAAAVADLVGVPGHRPTATTTATDPGQTACRDFTEQFVFSVSSLSDVEVDRLREALGSDRDVYEFVSALYVLDLVARVGTVTEQIFAEPEVTS